MFNITKTSVAAGIIALAAIGGATPAFAGQCPAAGANALANAPTMPKDVTDTVIGSMYVSKDVASANRKIPSP